MEATDCTYKTATYEENTKVSALRPEEIIDFFKKAPPFQFLEETELKKIARTVSLEFHPKGTLILSQDGAASDFLRIIKKGGVKVFVKSGEDKEVLIDYRSEGDAFGFLSLVSGDKSRANVLAVEDTITYLIKKETMTALLNANPSFSEFFLKSYLNKYIDKTYKEMQSKSVMYEGGEQLMFTTPVSRVTTRNIVTASEDISTREAAAIMSKNKISSLVLIDSSGVPCGIVTDRDMREKVVARGKNVDDRISSIMSRALIKAEAGDYCFEALLKMIRYNIHHLLVVEDGKLFGMLTNHDLMMLQGSSPISIAREIESVQTIEALCPASKKIAGIVKLLLREGAKASNVTRIITEINDRLVRRILEFSEKKFGYPPVEYCWITLGSEGRKEQTFKTDQDNAIIYFADSEREKEEAEKYFPEFTAYVRDALVNCGFPLCPAGLMASTPKWCQPLDVWKGYFSKWIQNPSPEALLHSLIFFDFRPVYGSVKLAEELRESVTRMLVDQNIFLAGMAGVITKNRPPLGFFKSFAVEKSGEHKDELDLKIRGIGPLIDLVRLFALEQGVKETSTLERIDALRASHPIVKEYGEEFEQAHEFITLLRIHHQVEQMESSLPLDNFINPTTLSSLEKKSLKESFRLILKVQDAITDFYRAGMVNS